MAKNDKMGDVLTADVVAAASAVAAGADMLSTSAAAAAPSAPPAAKAVADTAVVVAEVARAVAAEAPVEHIHFDQFWMMMSKKLKLLGHMKEILHADFKARGLSLQEPLHKFEDALKKFGYKG